MADMDLGASRQRIRYELAIRLDGTVWIDIAHISDMRERGNVEFCRDPMDGQHFFITMTRSVSRITTDSESTGAQLGLQTAQNHRYLVISCYIVDPFF